MATGSNAVYVNLGVVDVVRVSEVPVYDGEYAEIPTVDGITLLTAGKLMDSNLVITPIPYSEVSNPYGGSTVTIA